MILTDKNIVSRLKKGDFAAYKVMFEKYYKPLCVYAFKYTDSYALSEDIVQDFFVKFWDDKLYLKLNKKIGPYLYTSVKNNALQVLKKQRKFHFHDIENEVDKLITVENFEVNSLVSEYDKLHKEVEALPLKCREVFKAIVLDNQKYKDVALKMGVTVNTVKTQHSRALKQLRNSLG
ncbi:RNA polymerase sigma-70 factor [Tamlana sp. 62-3]|uniref:RNA polymerase sigma-70 factor n=1 Tax=Neotamlana sargassicola TaxID=2883125 RepID=A0A9X1I5U9_9FLAO|nr:RNA polymerase sigma-70 factor [Tamlana sargassicola]MCB4807837.1 RNA polymerase sigma-70 factor [Tamlana sargassicola]